MEIIKNILKTSSNMLGFQRTIASIIETRVVILRYHSINDNPENYINTIGTGIIHETSVFKRQMELLALKYNPISLDNAMAYLKGEKKIKPRSIVITFDDGFLDNYEFALPILNKFGIPATFYLTVDNIESIKSPWFVRLRYAFFTTNNEEWIGNSGTRFNLLSPEAKNGAFVNSCKWIAKLSENSQKEEVNAVERQLNVDTLEINNLMLNWDQVAKIRKSGHIIGSHTLSHPNLAYLKDKSGLITEFELSRKILEDRLDEKIIHFSYPSPILEPHWSEETITACIDAGYETAVTCTVGAVVKGDNLMKLKRIWVPFNLEEFIWNIDCTLSGLKKILK